MDACEEPRAAHLDDFLLAETCDRCAQPLADTSRAFGEPLVLEDVEHGEGSARGDGIATEGGERPAGVREPLCKLPSRDDRGDGVPITHRLAERHDVRRDSVGNEGPEAGAEPAVSRLHLVRDIEATGGVRPLEKQSQLGARRRVDPVAHERPVEERRGEPSVELRERRVQSCGKVGAAARGRDPSGRRRTFLGRPVLR